jgi:copper oxidase (laccase) domain-containing protein
MSRTLEKINKLEKELRALKLLLKPKIDWNVDEKVWQRVRKELKESRKKIYKKNLKIMDIN